MAATWARVVCTVHHTIYIYYLSRVQACVADASDYVADYSQEVDQFMAEEGLSPSSQTSTNAGGSDGAPLNSPD